MLNTVAQCMRHNDQEGRSVLLVIAPVCLSTALTDLITKSKPNGSGIKGTRLTNHFNRDVTTKCNIGLL